jgi:hypothetical protein
VKGQYLGVHKKGLIDPGKGSRPILAKDDFMEEVLWKRLPVKPEKKLATQSPS